MNAGRMKFYISKGKEKPIKGSLFCPPRSIFCSAKCLLPKLNGTIEREYFGLNKSWNLRPNRPLNRWSIWQKRTHIHNPPTKNKMCSFSSFQMAKRLLYFKDIFCGLSVNSLNCVCLTNKKDVKYFVRVFIFVFA